MASTETAIKFYVVEHVIMCVLGASMPLKMHCMSSGTVVALFSLLSIFPFFAP